MSGASSIGPDGLLVRFDNNNQDLCEKVDLFASDLRKQSIRTRRNTAQGYPLTLAIIESHDAKLGDEGYRLQTARDGAQVHANTNAGLFYGLQTFLQMLHRVGASWKIPHCRIVDRPALAMRGIHIDLKAQMLRFDYIMNMLHRCAQYKINTVLIEYEDKFPFRKHPRIVSPLALSRDEISQLVQTARTLNIRIIPKVQALAHAEYVLKHEQYNHLREHPDSPTDYCPLHPEYMPLIEDMFTEVIEAHRDSEYFHAGCDEPLLLGSCPKCKRRIAREGRGRFFADRLNRIHRLLESLGKKTIMWADRRFMYPEISPGLARDIVFMPWKYYDYSRLNDFSFYDHLVAQDMRVIVCSAARTRFDSSIFPDFESRNSTTMDFITRAAEDAPQVMGAICSSWASSRVPVENTWFGLLCAAEYAWSPDTSYADYKKRFCRNFYDASDNGITDAMENLKSDRAWNEALAGNNSTNLDIARIRTALARKAVQQLKQTRPRVKRNHYNYRFGELSAAATLHRQRRYELLKTLGVRYYRATLITNAQRRTDAIEAMISDLIDLRTDLHSLIRRTRTLNKGIFKPVEATKDVSLRYDDEQRVLAHNISRLRHSLRTLQRTGELPAWVTVGIIAEVKDIEYRVRNKPKTVSPYDDSWNLNL